jgi:hypothetical protein
MVWRLWETIPEMTMNTATEVTWEAHTKRRVVAKTCQRTRGTLRGAPAREGAHRVHRTNPLTRTSSRVRRAKEKRPEPIERRIPTFCFTADGCLGSDVRSASIPLETPQHCYVVTSSSPRCCVSQETPYAKQTGCPTLSPIQWNKARTKI